MNIVAINGSPHGMKGNTGTVLAQTIKAAEDAGASVETIVLSQSDVRPCVGCDMCHKIGFCSISDNFESIKEKLAAADGIILASPNYIFSVSAQMKAMLDRCCGPIHCQAWVGKYAAAVVTSGGEGYDAVEEYMLAFLQAMGCKTVGSVGADLAALFNPAEKQKVDAQAAELGKNLASAIENQQEFPEQQQQRDAFFARMKELVTMRKEDWPHEYAHWQNNNWL